LNKNSDQRTVESFGDEWTRFDQTAISDGEIEAIFNQYFAVFPWHMLPLQASGFDMGCGSGRWARLVAPRVGTLHCIDPSTALDIARDNLGNLPNVIFHHSGVDDSPLPDDSQDFGYSLGVLHHIPDTQEAVRSCVKMLKKGAPFLVYLYYAFDNRSFAYRALWRLSDVGRRVISLMPPAVKHFFTDIAAAIIYYPLARTSFVLEKLGLDVKNIPLSFYRGKSFYTMRTDSRDRFGTPLEKRFTREQIKSMMEKAGLSGIVISDVEPYWCAVGVKT